MRSGVDDGVIRTVAYVNSMVCSSNENSRTSSHCFSLAIFTTARTPTKVHHPRHGGEKADVPSHTMTTILDTFSHTSLNSSIHSSTSSERKHTTASYTSYTISPDVRNTPHGDNAVATRRPTNCCMCRHLTHLTTLGPFTLARPPRQGDNANTRHSRITRS